jgi:hypothetical protein
MGLVVVFGLVVGIAGLCVGDILYLIEWNGIDRMEWNGI